MTEKLEKKISDDLHEMVQQLKYQNSLLRQLIAKDTVVNNNLNVEPPKPQTNDKPLSQGLYDSISEGLNAFRDQNA